MKCLKQCSKNIILQRDEASSNQISTAAGMNFIKKMFSILFLFTLLIVLHTSYAFAVETEVTEVSEDYETLKSNYEALQQAYVDLYNTYQDALKRIEQLESNSSVGSSGITQTFSGELGVKIYENEFFSVTVDNIREHEAEFTVSNKTDGWFTIIVSDLVLDGEDCRSSDSCWEVYPGKEGELYYTNENVDLNMNALTISGVFEILDSDDDYLFYKEFPFEEVRIR